METTVATPAQPTATAIDAIASAAPKGAPNAPAAAQAAEPKGAVAEAPKAVEEFFEVPVNGKPKKVSKDELIRRYSLEEAADQRFNEAAKLRKEADGLLSKLKDPKKAIELLEDPSLGLDKEQIREAFEEWYHRRYIAPSEMTEEQKKLADAEERLKKYEEKERKEQERLEAEEQARQDEAASKQLMADIIKVMDTSGLPKTKFTASRIAYWMRVNDTKGIQAPAELIVSQVKKEMRSVMDSLVQSSEGDTLASLLGEDTVKKLRKYDLEQIRKRREAPPPTEPKIQKEETRAQQFERIRPSEVRRRAREFR